MGLAAARSRRRVREYIENKSELVKTLMHFVVVSRTPPDGSCASLASSTSSSSTAVADDRPSAGQYERTVSFGPVPGAVGARTALGQKPRTLSLELDGGQKATAGALKPTQQPAQSPQVATAASTFASAAAAAAGPAAGTVTDPIAPSRRRTGISKQPSAASGTKIMLVWLESYEDHLTLPVGEWRVEECVSEKRNEELYFRIVLQTTCSPTVAPARSNRRQPQPPPRPRRRQRRAPATVT